MTSKHEELARALECLSATQTNPDNCAGQAALFLRIQHGTIEFLRREIGYLKGRGLAPCIGTHATFMPLGDASVWVEYEFVGERVSILATLINGTIQDPDGLIAERQLELWAEELERSHKSDAAKL